LEIILKKILITGSNGFLGRNLISEISKLKNCEIIATYRKNKSHLKNFKNISLKKIDITSKKENWYLELDKPDIVIHLAWDYLNNFRDLKHKNKLLDLHNLFLSNLIINGLKNIIVSGTCLEYGKIEGELHENFKPKPIVPYAIAKNELRLKLLKLKKKHKFNFSWLRLFYIYGEKSNSKLYNELNLSIDKHNKYFRMSKGDQIRDFINIKILIKYISKIIINHRNFGVINVCSGKPITVKNLVNKWITDKKSNIKPIYGHYDYISYEPMKFWGSTKKLKKIIDK
jgi:nucleoside-diphosphate-sugar epimerase